MRVQNRRKAEASVLEDITDAEVRARHSNRIKNYWSLIPEPWDDKPHASAKEYHNKGRWAKIIEAANSPHWTKGRTQSNG
jgi:hypothetical protein